MTTDTGDARLCPQCGQPNACVLPANSSSTFSCWCKDYTVPESTKAKIASLNKSACQRCFCAACLQALGAIPPQ